MQHVIHTQQIELLVDDQKKAFRLQEQASRQFYTRVLPILERVFDQLGPEGEIVSIDRLEVDIGAIPEERLEDGSWVDELYDKILDQAKGFIREGGGRRRTIRRPVGAGIVEQWLAYMRTGRLPWSLIAIDREWLQRVLEQLAADHAAIVSVRRALAGGGALLQRVVEQHDETFLCILVEVLTAKSQASLPVALQEIGLIRRELAALRGSSEVGEVGPLWVGLPNGANPIFYLAVLRLAAREPATWTTEEIAGTLLRELRWRIVEVRSIRERFAGQLTVCDPLLAEMAVAGKNVIQSKEERNEEAAQRNERIKKAQRAETDKELEEGLFVPYAGLVLLHAFLPTFLGRVGLIKDGAFTDDTARIRAVQLLQFVATGLPDNPEYEGVIGKLLCALPLEEPVGREFRPASEELQETNGLLDACLAQWTVLQNTSREGLRVNFLNRNGMLTRNNGQLRLGVERMAFDLLLDQLPWNISLIKLPWMPDMLHVNWR